MKINRRGIDFCPDIQCLVLILCVSLVCAWVLKVKNMIVYVEKKVLEDPAISGDENFGVITKNFCTFREGLRPGCLGSACLDSIKKNQFGSFLKPDFYHLLTSQILMTSPIV